ncbi:MAG: hypothetical protein ACKVN9_02955 [Methylophilaceae bacterium]
MNINFMAHHKMANYNHNWLIETIFRVAERVPTVYLERNFPGSHSLG